jgi:predicted DNA-binding transcriptional regulator AlpA
MDSATRPSHGHTRRKPAYVPDDPLLDARESAAETGRGLSTFWRDVRARRLPPPYRVTPKCPRWRRSELRAAVEACRALAPVLVVLITLQRLALI